jgi:ethanolamine utilization protein EutN
MEGQAVKLAQVVGRVFCSRQEKTMDGKKLLLIQPLRWEDQSKVGDPLVAADAVGAGAGEKIYFVQARDAVVAFPDDPPVDAAVVGIVEGQQARSFR